MKSVKEQVEYLKNFVTDDKNELFSRLIRERTGYVRIVLEDLFQSHNQCAVMRTADCTGIQHIHIIENKNVYDETSTVSRGAKEWLSLHRHNEASENSLPLIRSLKQQGYRIIATTPHENDVLIDELDLAKGKMAFFFGTEHSGLSQTVLEEADEFVKIPMYGFTESLNVSVAAALLMYSVRGRLENSDINWRLPETEKQEILWQWYHKSVKAADEILERFCHEK